MIDSISALGGAFGRKARMLRRLRSTANSWARSFTSRQLGHGVLQAHAFEPGQRVASPAAHS